MSSTLKKCPDDLVERVSGAAIEVHREIGLGLLESVYEQALMLELASAEIMAGAQVVIPVYYKGNDLGLGFCADIVVDDCLILELKSVDEFLPVHVAQLITYLKLMRCKTGFLLDFNKKLLRDGIKRISI